jgi:hypothetical protein
MSEYNASTIDNNTDRAAKLLAVGQSSDNTNEYNPTLTDNSPSSNKAECIVYTKEKVTLPLFNTDLNTNSTEYLALVSDTSSVVTTTECNPEASNYLLPVANSKYSVSNKVASISHSDY